MGLYSSTCGFLGEGSFQRGRAGGRAGAQGKNELQTISVMTCGPSTSVELGEITARDDRLHVGLVVESVVRERAPKDEGELCSRHARKDQKRFDIEYRFDGAGFARVTPIPAAAKKAMEQD